LNSGAVIASGRRSFGNIREWRRCARRPLLRWLRIEPGYGGGAENGSAAAVWRLWVRLSFMCKVVC
jgi:hypothetical protein